LLLLLLEQSKLLEQTLLLLLLLMLLLGLKQCQLVCDRGGIVRLTTGARRVLENKQTVKQRQKQTNNHNKYKKQN
jgi:hypothetical protein